jgi:hypothetical protein
VSGRRRSAAASSEPTATFKVTFAPRPQAVALIAPPEPAGRLSRVTRLLVFAHKIDGMIRSGEIRDWADAARIVGVTRARMTQIANLLLLAPDVQEAILMLPLSPEGSNQITERGIRPFIEVSHWELQRVRIKSPSGPYMTVLY